MTALLRYVRATNKSLGGQPMLAVAQVDQPSEQRKSRPEGRLSAATGGEFLSRFPHRRNLLSALITERAHLCEGEATA